MTQYYGWNGKILNINLSEGRMEEQSVDPSLLKSFLGGRGINVWTLYQSLTESTDSFGPKNVLVFGAGPLVGTLIPANGRYNVSSRSPLTMLLGDANSAGFWAPPLKKSGYDGIVFREASDHPVYVLINEKGASLHQASHLWGKTVSETEKQLRHDHGQDAHVLAIGPAGENLVRFASILTDVDRAAGRTGNGAVMGSKKLKAIVVGSKGKVPVADSGGIHSVAKEIKTAMYSSPSFGARSQFGTPLLISLYNSMGVLPTHNHQTGIFAGAEQISGSRLKEKYVVKPKSCYLCPVHCSRYSVIREGKFAGLTMEGPEFETLSSMGSRLGIDDLESILYLNRRLNDLGMDSISTGGSIAYAMECYEKDLIGPADTDGLELTWGNTQAVIQLVHRIAYRQGFGDVLADGVRLASRKIKNSERYALHIKGMEVPMQEVRGLKAWGLGWAVASRGADHCRAFPVMETTWSPAQARAFFGSEKAADRFAYEGKAAMVKWAEDFGAVIDSMGLCKIAYIGLGIPPDLVARAFQAATGMEMDGEQILKTGERINNLERLLNLRLGLSPSQDTLPPRFIEEPLPEGPSKGEVIRIGEMVQEYYQLRKWDPVTGYPTKEKLNELRIADLKLNPYALIQV
ncbi:MAG: aldehyde ferredoxin oxidoreductase family protein [Thermodesulfobacteriota bacterium]